MQPRFDYSTEQYRAALQALLALEKYVRSSGLDHALLELIKVRCSQMNGCAYCIDMHTKDARAAGETEQRLYSLSAWRETPFYTPRERAALEWAESLTNVAASHVPDELYDRVRQQLSEEEVVKVSLATVAINSWNRLAIASRVTPGTYQPQSAAV